MPWPIEILFLLCAAFSIGCAVYYSVVLIRILLTARWLPAVRDGLDDPPPEHGWPSLCIVVPAHNEADVIEGHARSLLGQDYPGLRTVFALDRCTDDTEPRLRAVIADDPRAEIVTISTCPDDWAGKTHAIHTGVTASRGAPDAELLLFADADTLFEPGLCRAAVAMLFRRRLDLLSLLAVLSSEHWFERLVQPAAGFELIRQNPLDLVNRETEPRAFANGQFMLFRRTLYDHIGGHRAVKGELLEDIAFTRLLNRQRRKNPARWGVLLSGGLLRCRMYRSWEAFQRGWKRIYTEAGSRRPERLLEWSRRQILTGVVLPACAVATLGAGVAALLLADHPLALALLVAGAAGIAAMAIAMMRVYRDQGLPARLAFSYPYGALWTARILRRAARDLRRGRETQWGGRSYRRIVKAASR